MSNLTAANLGLSFERSERINQARRQSPSFLLAEDMANSAIESLHGMSKRVDKRISKYGERIVNSCLGRFSFVLTNLEKGQDLSVASLIPDEQSELIAAETWRHADTIGLGVLYGVASSGHFPLDSDYVHKRMRKNPFDTRSGTLLDHISNGWAPDYAQRFGQAVVLQNAGIVLGEGQQ